MSARPSVVESRVAEVLPILRCPATGSPLTLDDDGALVTEIGDRRYAVKDGVPLLISPEKSLFGIAPNEAEVHSRWSRSLAGLRRGMQWLLDLPPTPSRNIGTEENYAELAALLRDRHRPNDGFPRLLVVGGGTLGVGAEEILLNSDLDVIETDVYRGPRTRIVCDGHDLPFVDHSFDCVICQAVLEHVIDPWRVADEIWRVLKPDGYVYSEVPFMQQVHGGAFDFTRFTLLGHRRLWRMFDELRSGAQGGPGMALIWSIMYFVRSWLPRRLWAFADRGVSVCLFWLKYFDGYLTKRPGGLDAASGTFFLGRRRLAPVDDREIVLSYRGGGP
jgi:SAM-dependent methyltransferase